MSHRGTTDSTESTGADGDRGLAGGINRRKFVQSALAVGGAAAFGSLTDAFGGPNTAAASKSVSVPDRWNRQHAWGKFGGTDSGTPVPPGNHLILQLNLAEDAVDDDGTPTADARQAVEEALDEIENHYEWSDDGVMFTVGYSRAYFDRFDQDLPGPLSDPRASAGLIDPEVTVEAIAAPHEDPDEIDADSPDAVIHMASDDPRNLMDVELALWDDDAAASEFDETFEEVFERPTDYPQRRVGFAGHDTVTEKYGETFEGDDRWEGVEEKIPEQSDTSMGFTPLFRSSVPHEDIATMTEDQKLVDPAPPGIFAQGTIKHVSQVDVALDDWYDNNSLEERRHQMFSSKHDEERVGKTGENLGTSTATDEHTLRHPDEPDLAEMVEDHAEEEGVVGHAEKLARARFPVEERQVGDPAPMKDVDLRGHDEHQEFVQPVLRRDFNTADRGRPGVHFVGIMRFNGYMHYVRQAMNGSAFDSEDFALTGENRIQHGSIVEDVDGPNEEGENDNGIVPYLDTINRGNYLVPPISIRALPPARAVRPGMTVSGNDKLVPADRKNGKYKVTVDLSDTDLELDDIDAGTVRFGRTHAVNRGGGASPANVKERGDGTVVFQFGTDGTALVYEDVNHAGHDSDQGDGLTCRLFAKTEDGEPVRATVECSVAGNNNGRGN